MEKTLKKLRLLKHLIDTVQRIKATFVFDNYTLIIFPNNSPQTQTASHFKKIINSSFNLLSATKKTHIPNQQDAKRKYDDNTNMLTTLSKSQRSATITYKFFEKQNQVQTYDFFSPHTKTLGNQTVAAT